MIVRIYQHEQFLKTLEGKADSNGLAVFENVPAEAHSAAVASAKHQDMMFMLRGIENGVVNGENVFYATTSLR